MPNFLGPSSAALFVLCTVLISPANSQAPLSNRIPQALPSKGVVKTTLPVHGPFVMTGAALAKLKESKPPKAVLFAEQQLTVSASAGGMAPLPPRLPKGDGDPEKDPPALKPPKPEPAPKSSVAVVNGSAGVIDPQISVGVKDVLVTLRNNILLFKKTDITGKPAGTTVNAQVITADNFFSALTADINQHLVQPKGYGVAEGYGIDPAHFPGNTYYDARTVYDGYRKRFWVIALAITQKASPATKGTCTDPVRQSARRTKVAVAVSQGDDAFGNWNLYWWDANKDEDTDPRIASTKFFSHVDYPLLGISEKFLLVQNKADVCLTGPHLCDTPMVPACTPPDPKLQTENYGYITAAPADALSAGNAPAGKTVAFGFKSLQYPDGTVIPPGNSIAPAVHDGPVPFGLSFFANPYVDVNGNASLMVWFLDTLDPANPIFLNFAVPIRPLSRLNSPAGAPSAVFRGQELTVAFAERVGCSDPPSITAIRMVRVNVITARKILDGTTGTRSPNDPKGIDCIGYYQPGVQVNQKGDTGFIYVRQGKGVPTEARYSAVYHGSLTQPPSVELQGGAKDVGAGFDTIGVSLDPDDLGIWFVAPYGAATGAQIAIGRIW